MCDSESPVDLEKYVLRRLSVAPNTFNADSNPRIQPGAFRPSSQDQDGLSVFRASTITPEELVGRARSASAQYYVVRLQINRLKDLGFELVEDPQDGLPGHMLIPEINTNEYEGKDSSIKQRMKARMKILADLADEDVVYGPASPV